MAREHAIAVIPGDGIGEEVIREGLKVVGALADIYGFKLKLTRYPWSADHFLKTGVAHPDSAFDEYRQHAAVYLGAIGDPRLEVGMLERAVIAGLRFKLDLYVNLRPIKLYDERFCPLKDKKPADVDMVVVRENTEDAYTGIGGIFKQGTQDEVAIATMLYTRKGCERVIRYAFELAKNRPRKKLTLVDKANAVRPQDIWTRTFAEVAKEYPGVATDHAYIDAACMWLVKNPESFDCAVMPNIFGDIFTDLGAMVQGGLGIAASGNLHPGKTSMFEPIHGSAPKYRGKNVANPLAAINAGGMMLDYLGEKEAAAKVDQAIAALLTSGRIRSLNAGDHKTDEIGDLVTAEVQKLAKG
ncbi:MAG: 3-isopropylmalate dehydrogenase [Planctomycetes bacterium]|nr:3-isopropylmalate dehydrogenase [Planctomycetota bacterium]